METYRLILASSSPRRRELIQMLGLPVHIMASDADESIPADLPPDETVQLLAKRKAAHVLEQVRSQGLNGIIVGADTIVVLQGRMLGKPGSEEEAKAMLRALQGNKHEVHTGIACLDADSGKLKAASRKTTVWMKPLTEQQISAYVASGEPMDKAGAYGIQGLGSVLIERIDGDYFNVVGLSLFLLSELLSQFGIEALNAANKC